MTTKTTPETDCPTCGGTGFYTYNKMIKGIKKQKIDCATKVVFASEVDALAKAFFYQEHNRLNLRPYKCQLCNRWHLTKQDAS